MFLMNLQFLKYLKYLKLEGRTAKRATAHAFRKIIVQIFQHLMPYLKVDVDENTSLVTACPVEVGTDKSFPVDRVKRRLIAHSLVSHATAGPGSCKSTIGADGKSVDVCREIEVAAMDVVLSDLEFHRYVKLILGTCLKVHVAVHGVLELVVGRDKAGTLDGAVTIQVTGDDSAILACVCLLLDRSEHNVNVLVGESQFVLQLLAEVGKHLAAERGVNISVNYCEPDIILSLEDGTDYIPFGWLRRHKLTEEALQHEVVEDVVVKRKNTYRVPINGGSVCNSVCLHILIVFLFNYFA